MKEPTSGIDAFIEKLNNILSMLLGKRKNQPPQKNKPPKSVSNIGFGVIVMLCVVLLWIATGFYYIGDNQFGFILHSGKIAKVEYGQAIGLTYPYPFGDVVTLDGVMSDVLNINESDTNPTILLSEDLVPFRVEANFSYKVTDPKLLYIGYIQDPDNWDKQVLWQVQSTLHDFVANSKASLLRTESAAKLSGDILEQLDQSLASYGIIITAFKINTLVSENMTSPKTMSSYSESATVEDINHDESSSDQRNVFRGREFDRERNLSKGWR